MLSEDKCEEQNTISPFIRDVEGLWLADWAMQYARKKIYNSFFTLIRPVESTTILDVGVTSDMRMLSSNHLESSYPYKHRITCAGLEDGSHLEKIYCGIKFVHIQAGKKLPFENNSFNVVYSNAVVEHVGNRFEQEHFIKELCRVGQQVFLTTPNMLFPIELHTALPIIHWFPDSIWRMILNKLGYDFYADPQNLNPVSARDLMKMFPNSHEITIRQVGLGWRWFASNLVIIAESR